MSGHAITDIAQGAMPAILLFLVSTNGLNYAQAAGLSFALSLSSSLSQPVFGFAADKLSMTWLLPLGVILSGLGISMIGFFPDYYWLMFFFAVASGIGVAAYHPEGARMANRLSGQKKAGSMGIFTMGGSVGFALGPLIATPALLHLGLRGSFVFAITSSCMCAILVLMLPGMRSFVEKKEMNELKVKSKQRNEWLKFFWLSIAITSRSIIAHCLNIFLPMYWMVVLHQSKALSGLVVSFMVSMGAITTVIGGQLADRFGIGRIIKIGWIVLIPSIFFLTYISNPHLAFLMLVPVSIGSFLVHSPMVVLGQKYLSKNVGFSSGVTLGLGVSIGGVIAPLFGRYADINGLTSALRLLSVLPFLGLIIAFTTRPPANQ
jgi:FSR family fosmidomycin resistance protein-like MFS transporter